MLFPTHTSDLGLHTHQNPLFHVKVSDGHPIERPICSVEIITPDGSPNRHDIVRGKRDHIRNRPLEGKARLVGGTRMRCVCRLTVQN